MTIQKKVIVVNSDDGDWSGIFLSDGNATGSEHYTLWAENHSLHTQDWIELINNHHIESVEQMEVSWEYMHSIGSFPNNFEDIPEEKFV